MQKISPSDWPDDDITDDDAEIARIEENEDWPDEDSADEEWENLTAVVAGGYDDDGFYDDYPENEDEDTVTLSGSLKKVGTEVKNVCADTIQGQQKQVYNYAVVTGPEGQRYRLKAMIDSGNTLKSGIAITDNLRKKLGLKFHSIKQKQVGTADKKKKLIQIGESEEFMLQLEGLGAKWAGKASVFQTLSDEINVGTAALIKMGESQGKTPYLAFTPRGTQMGWMDPGEDLEGKMLIKTLKDEGQEQVKEDTWKQITEPRRRRDASIGTKSRAQPVFTTKDVILKGGSLNFIGVDSFEDKTLIEGKESGLKGLEVVTALYKGGQNRIAVLNQRKKEVIVRKGTQIAEARKVKERGKRAEGQDGIKEVRDEANTKVRLEEVWAELKLEENPILKSNPKVRGRLAALIEEYLDVFSKPEAMYGQTDLMEFDIELKPDARPAKARCRPLNPKQKESLQKQLDLWKREEVIEESNSPWAAALVPCLKKGGEARWAVDYRPLNAMTVADSYPLPRIADNLERLQGAKIFSTLDAAGAYHVIPVSKHTRPLLAFTTPFGLYQFRRLPFGVRNAVSAYSRFMDLLVSRLRSESIIVYLDDIIIATNGVEEHLRDLR